MLHLADVVEGVRDYGLKEFGLDCAYEYTISGFAIQALYKKTGARVELLYDKDYGCGFDGNKLYHVFMKDYEGGISHSSTRKCIAENLKELGDNNVDEYGRRVSYDPNKESTYINYLDSTSQYPTSMSHYKMITKINGVEEGSKWSVANILRVKKDGATGYFFNVDLDIPPELHD